MLSIIMLSVVMLSVIMLNVTNKPSVLNVVMLSVILLNVTYKPSMLNVVMLCVVRLNVIMLSVVAPIKLPLSEFFFNMVRNKFYSFLIQCYDLLKTFDMPINVLCICTFVE
jgi:hypothetical protein